MITITGADTSAVTVPTTTGSGSALAAGVGYVISFELSVEFPQDAALLFGESGADGGSWTLTTHNEFTDFDATALDGSANVDDPANNVREASIRLQRSGSLDKFFSGIWGAEGNTSAGDFTGGSVAVVEGPPGSGLRKDGNTVVMAGQAVQSVVTLGSSIPAGTGTELSQTLVACDVWDADRLALAAHPDWAGYNASYYPSNGEPVFPVLYRETTSNRPASELATTSAGYQNLRVEYGSGAAGAGEDSDCSTGEWFSDPGDVPGATVSTDDLGRTTWTGVNRVRLTVNTARPEGTAFADATLYVAITQVVLESEDETNIGNWVSQSAADGVLFSDGVLSPAAVYGSDTRTDSVPAYDPQTHSGNLGDRLIFGEASVRVSKSVLNPATGEFTGTAVPQYTAGATVTYRLSPTLTAGVTVEGNNQEVTVEDCLPRFQTFTSASQDGAALEPDVVQWGSPADAELECPANQQYLRWDLGLLPVGQPIAPIEVKAEVLDVARNTTYTNVVAVSSPADSSPLAARSDDVQVQLVVPTGIKISKVVDKSVIEVNPEGVTTPRTITWSVLFANIDGPTNVGEVDVIDVLPSNGANANDYTGSLEFLQASVAAGEDIQILYTAAATAGLSSDPTDATNLADGSTVWCTAVDGTGTVSSGTGTIADCPTSAAEVTALRFLRSGQFDPEDEFQVDIEMVPVGNAAGDHYVNLAEGVAEGVTQGVGPARRGVDVVASSVGDRIWEDLNGDGLQDEGEPGVPDWPVRLVGTDVDGNAVDLTTSTDASGNYLFAGLASGTYQVDFSNLPMPVNTTWTLANAGDPEIDSDADPSSGQSAEFSLGVDTADLSLDAGIVVDRNVQISVEKTLSSISEMDKDGAISVVYDIVVTNSGTAQGEYDLDDRFQFGEGVSVDSVAVANTDPGDIVVNDSFDGEADTVIVTGQPLAGGSSHTFQVTVEATIARSATTESLNCELVSSESGTGFLNEAAVTVGDTVTTSTACGETDPWPPEDDDLAFTGSDAGLLALAGVVVVAAGMALVRRRK